MNRTFLTIFGLLYFGLLSYSQSPFQGVVVDELGDPIIDAMAVRLSNEQGTILESTQVDAVGYFSFPSVDFAIESIMVIALGYATEEVKAPVEKIILQQLSTYLDEVQVVARANMIQRSDRLIFQNFHENLVSGNSSYGLLLMTPLIEERDNTISIVGKESVVLYVNGRKSNLPQEAIRSYLQGLPAENIASIELITNPGPMFSASGNQGVINLILKRNEADGIKGSLRAGSSQTLKTNSQDGSFYLDIQQSRLNVTAGVYANNFNIYAERTTKYWFYNANRFDEANEQSNTNVALAGSNIRADYHLKTNHTLGALLNLSHFGRNDKTNSHLAFHPLHSATADSLFDTHSNRQVPTNRFSANLNYRATLSEAGSNFTIDVDYVRNNSEENVLSDFHRLASAGVAPNHSVFDQNSTDLLESYAARIDYRHVFNSRHSLSSGVSWSQTSSKARFYYAQIDGGIPIPDPTKNNRFNYNETFFAGYFSYDWELNPKLSGRAGLRIENADSKGIQEVTGEIVERTDFNLIPNLSVLYRINATDRLTYNLSSFAARPRYQLLNPFRFYLNPNTFIGYNPHLKTGRAYSQNIMYTLRNNYIFQLSHMYTQNGTNNFWHC